MKKIITLSSILVLLSNLSASEITPQDSNRISFKIGIGVFSGLSSYSTNTAGFSTTYNNGGLDIGASIKTSALLKRKCTISLEFRYTRKNTFLEYQHPVFANSVFFSQSYFQLPLYFSYRFFHSDKELFQLSVGGAMGKSHNEFLFGQGGTFSPQQSFENVAYSESESWHQSALFSISKTFKVGNKSYISIYNEHEIQLDKGIRVGNVVSGGANPSIFTVNSYPVYFKYYTPRIGVHYIF